MQCNAKGKALIKRFEGLRLEAYPDPATGAQPWTIGYGHTGNVKPGDIITAGEADRLLDADVARFEAILNAMVGGVATSEDEFSAMVSLMFNIGPGKFATSTLLRRHKQGNRIGAANAFLMWNKGGGRVMAGLMRRREAEKSLYMSEAA